MPVWGKNTTALQSASTPRSPSARLSLRANHSSSLCSGTSASCWWAALALVRTAPRLLRNGPTCHPIGKSCITIVWFGRSQTPTTRVGAAFAVNPAAPLLLGHRPACLPVRESVGAVVGIRRGRLLRRLATDVVDPAAPLLLGLVPRQVLPHC